MNQENDNLVPTDAQLRKALETIQNGIMRDPVRAAALGLIPEPGHKISERFQFVVNPSNVEEIEDKKMRGYRHKEYPKTMHGWGADPETGADGPLTVTVRNPKEAENARAAGWTDEPHYGPAGRLERGKPVQAEEVAEVREFAAPGQQQPFEEPKPEAVKPMKKAKAGKK